jgi:hypothetical protein
MGASVRAFLVALLIVMPALLLGHAGQGGAEIAAMLAVAAAALTFVEYYSEYPSLLEFRNAPPFNRMRFVALFATVFLMTVISRDGATGPLAALEQIGAAIGHAMDFPFSPVRLMVLVAPDNTTPGQLDLLRSFAGLAYLVSLITLLVFVVLVRLFNWPIRKGPFNFWVNLPLFDPTAGGDVLNRLKRDSQFNVALGFLLPFLIPATLQAASAYAYQVDLSDPQTLIWTLSAWAFLPASLIMRGVALMRIADLIEQKRRRAYAQADLHAAA